MKLRRLTVPAVLFGATLPLAAQQIQISKENKTIAISTSDEASAPADTAVVNIGFRLFGKEEQATYSEASQVSNAIVAALSSAGLPKYSLESTNQGLHPMEASSDDDKARFAQGMRFSFNQDWRLTVAADQAGKALQIAIAAGANNSGNVDWQLKHDNALQAEAAAKALAHARDIATTMAKGLGAKLGALVYASNQTPARQFALYAQRSELNTSSASMSVQLVRPLAIVPQRITRSATVYAVFAIE